MHKDKVYILHCDLLINLNENSVQYICILNRQKYSYTSRFIVELNILSVYRKLVLYT